MIQLNPQIPLITPKGRGWAFFLIDRSQEHDLEWVVFLDKTGECWTFCNSDVRIEKNFTMKRNLRDRNPFKSSNSPELGEQNGRSVDFI
jgi:hypothetical protein